MLVAKTGPNGFGATLWAGGLTVSPRAEARVQKRGYGMSRLRRFRRHGPLGRLAGACLGVLIGGSFVLVVLPAAVASSDPSSPAVTRPDPYQFNAPIAAAAVGFDLYVANSAGNTVTEVSSPSGAFLASVGGPTFGFSGPTAIATVGTQLVVANGTGNSLTEFNAGSNTLVRQISGSQYKFSQPVALTVVNGDIYVLSSGGSVTEVNATTGQLVGVASGPTFGFSQPTSIAAAGGDIFVTNSSANSVTELNAQTLAFVATLSGTKYQFAQPTGIAAVGNGLWVTNQAASSVTEFNALTGHVVRVVVSGYLPTPGPITFGQGYVFTASPPGSSPMVSQITPQTGAVNWMMCNTNGPYLFDNPQALVTVGAKLWVINEGGNSLTEMVAASGALVRTVR